MKNFTFLRNNTHLKDKKPLSHYYGSKKYMHFFFGYFETINIEDLSSAQRGETSSVRAPAELLGTDWRSLYLGRRVLRRK